MRVLLPVDTDEDRAVATAEAVTTLPDAAESVQVTILNVEPKVDYPSGDGGRVDSEVWYDEERFPASVEKAVAVLENAGISVEKQRKHGDPEEAIVEAVDEFDADWVVMAGRRRTPVGKVLFGSVTQSVLLHATVPVTVVSAKDE
jgi:nucleotide-binding universal stress UspA family protein